MADVTVRTGIDQLMFIRDRYINCKIATEITDRVPTQSKPAQKQDEAEKVKSARIRDGRAREKPDHLDPEPKAYCDDRPEKNEGATVVRNSLRPRSPGDSEVKLREAVDRAQQQWIRQSHEQLVLEEMSPIKDSAARGIHRQAESVAVSMNLWADLDCRAVRRHPPKFFDLFVGKSDATDGPILPTMERAHPAKSISNPVDHDVKTGGDTSLCSACVIIVRRIGNVQRKMKAALRIPAVDLIDTFRRVHVPLLLL